MRRPLYLHIGHGKAGSSTIQVALGREIERLRAAGFLVADRAMQFAESGPLDGCPVNYVAARCAEREAGLRTVTERFHAVAQTLQGRDGRLVVSAESFAVPGAEYLAQALRHAFEIHVVYYVRRQEDWIPSAWNQWGSREGLSLAAYLDRALATPQPNYERVLERWEPVADTVRVRPLHAGGLDGGRVDADFFAAIGAGFAPAAGPRQNEGLDLGLLEVFASSPFLFSHGDDEPDVGATSALREWLAQRLPASLRSDRPLLDGAQRQRVRAAFREANLRLQQRWFPDVEFDAVFGPAEDEAAIAERAEAQRREGAELDRLRRVVGLQLELIHELRERIAVLESRSD